MKTHASRRSLFLALLAALALPEPAGAQPIPKQKGPARTVRMFDFYCLSRLPDLESIERAAGLGEYDQLTGEDAAPYIPGTPPERFHAWRFHEQGEPFVLTAFRAPVSEAVKADAPGLPAMPAATCTFHIPASDPALILAELTKLLRRPADKSDPVQGAHVWNLQTPKAFSQVRFSAPLGAAPVLSGLVLLKN